MPANPPWFFTPFSVKDDGFPQTLDISDSALAHHVKNGMRLRPGEALVLIDPQAGQPILATLRAIKGETLSVMLEKYLPIPNRPTLKTIAIVALLKEQKWDWLLQKLTEIGVREIIPVLSERTVVSSKTSHAKLARWHSIMQHAAQQCERPDLPQLYLPVSLADCLGGLTASDELHPRWLASEWDGPTALPPLQALQTAQTVTFAIGPEGGWTQAELDRMQSAGFETVHLGAKILRAETAAVYLASVIDYAALTHAATA